MWARQIVWFQVMRPAYDEFFIYKGPGDIPKLFIEKYMWWNSSHMYY